MARGAKPGTRMGGRQKGTPNKATAEKLEQARLEEKAKNAERDMSIAARKHIKLGKDVLEDYMVAFGGIAATYQNQLAELVKAGLPDPDANPVAFAKFTRAMDAFEKWGTLTVTTAGKLAEFQSPKFKAIAVMPTPPAPNVPANGNALPKDPAAAAKAYLSLIKQVK